jgi:hypothetical protein
MRRNAILVVGAGILGLCAAGVTASYLTITGGRVKTCGVHEILHCGFFSSTECGLEVTVRNCRADGSGISVDEPDLHMCTGRKIVWTLTSSGYKFADDGIDFKDANPDFNGKVKRDDKFVWVNKHTHPANDSEPAKPWPYKVHILKRNDTDCATLDPRIYNE